MKHPRITHRRLVVTALAVLGILLSLFALQSVALWLPYTWAYGFAANATVWPLVQLLVCLCAIVLAIVLWKLRKMPHVAVVFFALGIVSFVPTMQMVIGVHQFAMQYHAPIHVSDAFNVARSAYLPDEQQITYGRVENSDLPLSLYRPNQARATPNPVIVYVHGGGWSGGSRTENGDFFRWLNDQGYMVASIDYRVARAGYASWRDAPRDVVCALSWVQANAQKESFDLSRVIIMGDSAGGQLALRAAYGVANGDVDSSCGGTLVAPYKVVGIVPAVDFRALYDDPKFGTVSRENAVRYLGGDPHSVPNRYDDATIATHVRPNLMPTLIINAANDTLVSVDSGVALAQRLRANGNEVEQYTLPYAAHSYWINPGGLQNRTAQKIIINFLEK